MQRPEAIGEELVEQAQGGDEQALEVILSRLQPMLRAYFMDRVGSKPSFRPEVDDLIQNTLLRVHNGLVDLKDPRRLKAFTMKAALFELQDLYRGRYGPKERLYDPGYPPEQPTLDADVDDRFDLERALAQLSPKARKIIELREYGYRYEEIARMINSTEAAIKMQVKRAFEKMRDALVGLVAVLMLFEGWF